MKIQRVLLTTATWLEMEPLILSMGLPTPDPDSWISWQALELQMLVTGPGIPNTSFQLGKRLANDLPDLLLHFGIAGGKPGTFEPGEVVLVKEDRFGDIGAEDSDGTFLDMFNLGLWTTDPPWTDAHLINQRSLPLQLPYSVAKGLTVNLIPGTAEHIRRMSRRYEYDVESMEGAAVLHAAGLVGVPCLCLRGISNLIEPRNRGSWQIEKSVQGVCRAVQDVLDQLNQAVDQSG